MGDVMRRFKIRSPQVIHETVQGEVVIVNLETGHYYSLAGTGERIWAAVDRAESVREILAEIHACYDDTGDHLEETVQSFLNELEREGLIAPCNGEEPSPAGDRPPSVGTKERFKAPALETFTDMRDLILLDPVHEVQEDKGWPHPKPAR
jgi:hypothetical protein